MALLSDTASEQFGNVQIGCPPMQGSPKAAVAGPSHMCANATCAVQKPPPIEPVMETALIPNNTNEVPGTEQAPCMVQQPACCGCTHCGKGKA